MALAIVALGSNKGHRRSYIERAVALISSLPGIDDFRCSEIIETLPDGFESDSRFLNACVAFTTRLSPERLFEQLQSIERSISPSPHRNDNGEYIDREIDIDFIACSHIHLSTPTLILPHPRAKERSFVMDPIKEIAPDMWKWLSTDAR